MQSIDLQIQHIRKRVSISKNLPTPIHVSSSSSDSEIQPLLRRKRSESGVMKSQINDRLTTLEYLLHSMKTLIDSLKPVKRRKLDSVSAIFSCIICKETSLNSDPVVPQCCSGVVACKVCLEGWIQESATCPQCREPISLDVCLPIPPLRPLSAFIQAKDMEGCSSASDQLLQL